MGHSIQPVAVQPSADTQSQILDRDSSHQGVSVVAPVLDQQGKPADVRSASPSRFPDSIFSTENKNGISQMPSSPITDQDLAAKPPVDPPSSGVSMQNQR